MGNRPRTTTNHLHWYILLLAVVVALASWFLWLPIVMPWARSKVLEHLEARQSAKASHPSEEISDATDTTEPHEREKLFAEFGQTGDSFGALNALVTAVAGALVFWAGYMQYESLKQAREEARHERDHRKLQEFEALFFQLLQLNATVSERIERTVHSSRPDSQLAHTERRVGPRALDSFARMICNSKSAGANLDPKLELKNLVDRFATKVYGKNPSAFGPYFRLLYQTFKHIAESSLSEPEQIRYANIARGQISEGAVLLLALNGLSQYGFKFVPLIEKFGLLEHLHPRYRERYRDILSIGYRPRAFMGSSERGDSGNHWISQPLLSENHFGV